MKSTVAALVPFATFATFAAAGIAPVSFGLLSGCHKAPDELQAPSATSVVEVPAATEGGSPITASTKRNPPSCLVQTPRSAPGPIPERARSCPPDTEGRAMLPVLAVKFEEAGISVAAEFARAPHDLEKGLMYRTEMPESEGMLFDLGERTIHRFWMHNTCIPLDMLFIDGDGTIVGIVENAPTLNDGERSVECASSFVLEVNAGYTRQHGIRAGQHVTLPSR